MTLNIRGSIATWLQTTSRYVIVDAIISVVAGISATLYHCRRHGYRETFRALILAPGLIFALSVNVVMYFLLFLPVMGLAKVWDTFFVEHIEVIKDGCSEDFHAGEIIQMESGMRRPSVCMSETISELDLNNCGEEQGTHSETEKRIKGEEKFFSLLSLRKDC